MKKSIRVHRDEAEGESHPVGARHLHRRGGSWLEDGLTLRVHRESVPTRANHLHDPAYQFLASVIVNLIHMHPGDQRGVGLRGSTRTDAKEGIGGSAEFS